MGRKLAQEVSDQWGHLPAGPYKLLMRMALYSLDESTDLDRPPGHYWRGWAHLARALGRKPPSDDDDTPEAATKRNTMRDEVKRHTNTLVRLGAVQRSVDNPSRGWRQVWKLTL